MIWLPIFLTGIGILGIAPCIIAPLSIWITHAPKARMKDPIHIETIKYAGKLPIPTMWGLNYTVIDEPIDSEGSQKFS
jgi:hypothetical protein